MQIKRSARQARIGPGSTPICPSSEPRFKGKPLALVSLKSGAAMHTPQINKRRGPDALLRNGTNGRAS